MFYADNRLHFFHFLQVADNGIHVFHIVYIELDVAFEQSVHRFNEYLTDVDIELFGHDVAYLVQDAQCVDTLNVQVDREFQSLASFPFYGQDTVAEACFQLVGYMTLALVNNYAVLVIDEAQSVVTRNRLTAIGDDEVLLECFRSELQYLLAVNLLLRCLFLRLLLFLVAFSANERKRGTMPCPE